MPPSGWRTVNPQGAKRVIVRADKRAYDPLGRSLGIDALISPRLHGIGLFDFHCAEELIRRGEAATRRDA